MLLVGNQYSFMTKYLFKMCSGMYLNAIDRTSIKYKRWGEFVVNEFYPKISTRESRSTHDSSRQYFNLLVIASHNGDNGSFCTEQDLLCCTAEQCLPDW